MSFSVSLKRKNQSFYSLLNCVRVVEAIDLLNNNLHLAGLLVFLLFEEKNLTARCEVPLCILGLHLDQKFHDRVNLVV